MDITTFFCILRLPVYSGDLDVVCVSDGGSVLNEGGGPLLTAGTRGVGGGGNPAVN